MCKDCRETINIWKIDQELLLLFLNKFNSPLFLLFITSLLHLTLLNYPLHLETLKFSWQHFTWFFSVFSWSVFSFSPDRTALMNFQCLAFNTFIPLIWTVHPSQRFCSYLISDNSQSFQTLFPTQFIFIPLQLPALSFIFLVFYWYAIWPKINLPYLEKTKAFLLLFLLEIPPLSPKFNMYYLYFLPFLFISTGVPGPIISCNEISPESVLFCCYMLGPDSLSCPCCCNWSVSFCETKLSPV